MSGTATEGGNAAAPSPLTVGKSFVKQYYQVLQTNTDQIHRFYQPTSFLSDAEGSDPTDPSGLENYEIAGRWGIIGGETKGFAMEIGAIDAQTSIDNSILLVVTGSVSSSYKSPRKTFIHTFFLAFIPNTKRFYVANDVLRFLEVKADAVEENTKEKNEDIKKVEVSPEAEEVPAVEKPSEVTPTPPDIEASPGGGVEESKEVEEEDQPVVEEYVVVDPVVEKAPEVEAKKDVKQEVKDGGRGKRGKGKGEKQTKQQTAPKATPGSWASLVASSPAAPIPPSPSRPTLVEKSEPTEKAPVSAPAAQKEKEPAGKEKGTQQRPKRDPDCTLVLKNLPDGANDADLVALFETYASSTGGKILGTTVSVHRGLGFVDFDSVPPVMAAVAKHQETPIELNGRVLEVDQKTAEQRARRNKAGNNFNQGGSAGNNGNGFRGGNGGRGGNQYRRDNKGRGGRGRGNGGTNAGK